MSDQPYQEPKPYGVTPKFWDYYQDVREKTIGYRPTYWENPKRVARYHNLVQSLKPDEQPPSWLDVNQLNTAYEYLKWRNEDRPYWMWNWLPDNDPGRQVLQSMAAPPQDALWPNEYAQYGQPQSQQPIPPTTEQGELDLSGLTPEQYDALPLWQKAMIGMSSNPKTSAALLGGVLGLQAGPAGAVVGAGLGAGLASLSEKHPSLAQWLMYLDYPAEWLERGAGSLVLIGMGGLGGFEKATTGQTSLPESAQEIFKNFKAAWDAAHLTYEVMPVGFGGEQVYDLGSATPRDSKYAGYEGLVYAYNEIRKGRSPEEVYEEMLPELGASAQAREMLGHILADPLNGVGLITNRGVLAPAAKLAGNDVLAAAARATGGPVEALQQYGVLLRTGAAGKTVEEISHMDAISRMLAGVTEAGVVKALDPAKPSQVRRIGGALTLGGLGSVIGYGIAGPIGAAALGAGGATMGYWKFLTPASRATEVVNNAALDMALILERSQGDPDTMVRFIKSVANTPHELARELSMASIEAPEGAALPLALRDFGGKADEMLTAWHATDWQRGVLQGIADVTGKTEAEVLKEIGDTKNAEVLFRQYVDAARASGEESAQGLIQAVDEGRFTPASLKEFTKAFVQDGLAFNEDMFRGQLYAGMVEHMAEWAATWFNVKPDPAIIRLSKTIKSAQSLILLGLNPTYFINNALNNFVTSAATGVFGLRSEKNIAKLWQRVGVTPERLRAGLGPAAAGDAIPIEPIRKATIQKGKLQDLDAFFNSASNKLGLFSKLSARVESWSSAQAMTAGFQQGWSRLWKRGTGYDAMPPALERMLRAVDPGLPDLVDDAIRGGMNQQEVEAALWSGVTRRSVDGFIPEVAAANGMSEAAVREALVQSGAYDFLQERLQGDPSDEQVRQAFRDLQDHIQNNLDKLTRQELVGEAEKVAARVQGEGAQAALEIYDRIEIDEALRWLENFDDWEKVFAETAEMDPGARGAVIRKQFDLENAAWRRQQANKEASYLGIAKALGIESEHSRGFISKLVENNDNWKEFHKVRREKLAEFFNTIFTNKARRSSAWNDLQKELDRLYADYAGKEQLLQAEMDEIFAGMFEAQYGRGAGEAARAWRKGVRDIRDVMVRDMREHRASIEGLPLDEKRAAWTQFLNQNYRPAIMQRFQENIAGAARMYEIATGRQAPPTPEGAPVPPPEAPPSQPEIRVATAQVDGGRVQELMDSGMSKQEAIGQALREQREAAEAAAQAPAEGELPGMAAAPPRVALTPEQLGRAAEARAVAMRYGLASADEAGNPIPGADRHILNVVRKYGGEEARAYQSLADVDPAVAEQAFAKQAAMQQAMEAAQARLPETPPKAAEEVEKPEVTPEMKKKASEEFAQEVKESRNSGLYAPRKNLAQEFPDVETAGLNEAIQYEAHALLGELSGAGVERTEVEEGRYIRGSSNPDWYKSLYEEGFTNRDSIENALQRIIEDETKDTIRNNEKTIERMKELILARLSGDEPAPAPPHPLVLLLRDREDEAALALGEWISSDWAASATDEDWMKLTGSMENFDRLFARWGELTEVDEVVEAIPSPEAIPPTTELTPIITQEEIAAGVSKVMEQVRERERLLAKVEEWTANIEKPLQLEAGDARETLRDVFLNIYRMPEAEVDNVMALADARAQTWAKVHGRTPAEWYQTRIAGGAVGGVFEDEFTLPQGFDLGPKLTEFYHDAAGAIQKLRELKSGEAIGALYHPEVGDIDLIWGSEGPTKAKGFGLAKIVKYHPEIVEDLQGIIGEMSVVRKTSNRVWLESETHFALLSLNWFGEEKRWLLTAYGKAGSTPTGRTMDISGPLKQWDDTAPPLQSGSDLSIADLGGGFKGDRLYQEASQQVHPIWYSQLERAVEGIPQETMTVDQLRGMIKKSGVKPDELKWTGLDDFLAKRKGKVTKQEVLDYLAQNRVEVQEVLYGAGEDSRVADLDVRIEALQGAYDDLWNQMMQEGRNLQRDLLNAGLELDEAEQISNNWELGGEQKARQILGDERIDAYLDYSNRAVETFQELDRLRAERRRLTSQAKYANYTLPGGKNYRELLLTLPERPIDSGGYWVTVDGGSPIFETVEEANRWAVANGWDPTGANFERRVNILPVNDDIPGVDDYRSPHWREPNVLAHVRFNERTDADGKRVLFIEEVQSDWHQAGREKGYKGTTPLLLELPEGWTVRERDWVADDTPGWTRYYVADERGNPISGGRTREEAIANSRRYMTESGKVPAAPFSKTWPELVMKRMLRWAAENGFDRVAWTTGEQQAERYHLAQHLESVYWQPDGGILTVLTRDGEYRQVASGLDEMKLPDYIGEEAAKKILQPEAYDETWSADSGVAVHSISGDDLSVGGEGMKTFYDRMLPKAMEKYGKKWGVKVGTTEVITEKLTWSDYSTQKGELVHSVDVTSEMKDSIMQGQPLFQRAKGAISFAEDGRAILHALQGPDVSTAVHELGHIFRRDLEAEDLRIAEEWAGVKDGIWERDHEEQFARGFERYLAEGAAPSSELQRVFENFKRWLLKIYTAILGSPIDVEITPAIRGVFDRLLAEEAQYGVSKGGQMDMFGKGEDLPLFSGAAMGGKESVFKPAEQTQQEAMFPDLMRPQMEGAVQGGEATGPLFRDGQVFEGQTIAVRAIKKRDGSVEYGVYRPPNKNAVIDGFPTMEEANAVAQYIEEHGGSYAAAERKAAKQHAKEAIRGKTSPPPTEPTTFFQEEYPPTDWLLTDNGSKRVLDELEDGVVVQDGDGTVEQVRLNGENPEAATLPLGAVEGMDPAPPLRKMQEEAWNEMIWPILQQIESKMLGPEGKAPVSVKGAQLDPATLRELRAYLAQVYGQMADTKLASIRWGENRRDAALLNYSRRYEFDNVLGAIFPYQFWYTRSALQWALRAIDRPAWLANYARLRNMQDRTVEQPGFPTRLRRKMRMPVPYLPEWAGGAVYIDPLHQLFPFEQLAQPMERYYEQQSQSDRRAEYILQNWVADEEITLQEAQQAVQTREGPLWQKAVTQAAMELEGEISNPFDFMSIMSGPSLPISMAYNYARGKPEKISQLPVTRLVQSLTAWMKPGGVNIEAPLRRAMGLPERGEFGDFYIDRELANMAADGYPLEEIQRAMVDRDGPVYLEALSRVGKQQAVRLAGSALWLDFFPEGEQAQRKLQQEFSAAIDSGDTDRLQKFFEENPEYRARLMMTDWENPEERLRQFLISEVWDRYRALPDLHAKQVREALGSVFDEAFLNKETRSYDAIDTATLAWWSKTMGGYLPKGAPEGPQVDIDLASEAVTGTYQRFVDERNQKFPGIFDLQNILYGLPPEKQQDMRQRFPQLNEYQAWRDTFLAKHPEIIPYATSEQNALAKAPAEVQQRVYEYRAERARLFPDIFETQDQYYQLESAKRKAFRAQHPELVMYWEWQRAFMAEFPETIPYIKSVESIAESVLGKDYQEKYLGLPPTTEPAAVDPQDFSPALVRQLMGYYFGGEKLGSGGRKALRRIWEKQGSPGGSFNAWIDGALRANFGGSY